MKSFATVVVHPLPHLEPEVLQRLGRTPVEEGDDGVVEYKSAHIDGVESELIVRSGHSTQATPATIEEVRRILLLHLRDAPPRER